MSLLQSWVALRGRLLQVARLRPRRPAPQWTLARTQAGDGRTRPDRSNLWDDPRPPVRAAWLPAPRGSGREGGVSEAGGRTGGRAGGRAPCIKSAGSSAVRASLAVCRRDRECRGKATAEDRALRSGYPMLGLSAAAARAICWSTRTAKRNRHTAAWAGSQRCLSL